MRTITFEVEVDEEIIPTLEPDIEGELFANAPLGRSYLCRQQDVMRIAQIRQTTDKSDNKRMYLALFDLPDSMRIVAERKSGMAGGKSEAEPMPEAEHDAAAECITPSTLHEDHRVIIEAVCGLQHVVNLINENVSNLVENQNTNCSWMHDKFEAAFMHFKQVHEYHVDQSNHFAQLDNRLMKHIQECCDKATLTTQTFGHDVLRALPELEDRIKEYIGEPDAQVQRPTEEVTPQALLKAIEIVSGAMLRGAK